MVRSPHICQHMHWLQPLSRRHILVVLACAGLAMVIISQHIFSQQNEHVQQLELVVAAKEQALRQQVLPGVVLGELMDPNNSFSSPPRVAFQLEGWGCSPGPPHVCKASISSGFMMPSVGLSITSLNANNAPNIGNLFRAMISTGDDCATSYAAVHDLGNGSYHATIRFPFPGTHHVHVLLDSPAAHFDSTTLFELPTTIHSFQVQDSNKLSRHPRKSRSSAEAGYWCGGNNATDDWADLSSIVVHRSNLLENRRAGVSNAESLAASRRCGQGAPWNSDEKISWWTPHCLPRPNRREWLRACFRDHKLALIGDSMTYQPFCAMTKSLLSDPELGFAFPAGISDFSAKWHHDALFPSAKSNSMLLYSFPRNATSSFGSACGYDTIFYNLGLHYLNYPVDEYQKVVRAHLDSLVACKPKQLWVRLISSINMDRVPLEYNGFTNTRRVLEFNNILRVEAKVRRLPVMDAYSTTMAGYPIWADDALHYNGEVRAALADQMLQAAFSTCR